MLIAQVVDEDPADAVGRSALGDEARRNGLRSRWCADRAASAASCSSRSTTRVKRRVRPCSMRSAAGTPRCMMTGAAQGRKLAAAVWPLPSEPGASAATETHVAGDYRQGATMNTVRSSSQP